MKKLLITSDQQNNRTTKSGGENKNETTESGGENRVNTANASTGVGVTSSNEENHISAATEPEIPEESGWLRRKRVLRQLADALNRCLCGLVLDGSSGGVLRCKQAGCETQWVSMLYCGCSSTHLMCLVSPSVRRT